MKGVHMLLLKVLGITLLFIIGLFIVLLLWSCCVVSSHSSRKDDELEFQHRTDDLSTLEKMGLEECINAYKNYGINFISDKNQEDEEEEI
jgi:hypothetical protein